MLRPAALLLLAAAVADDPDPPGFRRPAFKPGMPADLCRAVEAGTVERLDEARSLWRSVEFQEGVVARLKAAKAIPKEKGTKFAPAISAEQIAGRRTEAEAELADYRGRLARVGADVGFVPALRRRPRPGDIGTLTVGPGQVVQVLDDGRLVRLAAGAWPAFWPARTVPRFDTPVRFLGRAGVASPSGVRVGEVFEPAPVLPWLTPE